MYSMKDEINSRKMFLDSIEHKDVKTIIEFEIPAPLPINNPVTFKFNGIEHVLIMEIVENPASNIKGTGLPLNEDKYGLVKKSKINLTISKYIDPNEWVEIKSFSDIKIIPKAFLEAINALNYFIERYKIITGDYWIDKVFFKMIPYFYCEFKLNSQRFGNRSRTYGPGFNISPKIHYLNETEMARLNNYLEIEEIHLWEILLLDAKDYLLRRDYREAIYSINGAFENFLMIKAREKLERSWHTNEVTEYLEGIPIYEYHDLKEYMTEESFNKAVINNKIRPYVPPTRKIIKKCNQMAPSSISHNKLKKLIYKIRRKRNEVMHGTEIDEDLEKIAFTAIKSFEEFVKVF